MSCRFVVLAVLSLLAACLVLPGCSRKATGPTFPEGQALGEIWALYKGGKHQAGRIPKGMPDFKPQAAIHPNGYEAVRSARCLVFWGVDLTKTPDAGNTVLAYEKNVPTKGGSVLMADGTVKTMTAAEFQATARPKK
jgi:hypothetical protein